MFAAQNSYFSSPLFFPKIAWYFSSIIFIFSIQSVGLLFILLLIFVALEKMLRKSHGKISLLKLGAFMMFFVLLRTLLVHRGAVVLFEIPRSWPVLGGAVTMEGLEGALVIGLQLLLVMAWSFMAQRMITIYEWIRFFPKRLRDISTVLLVSIKTIPQLKRTFEETKRMHENRGREFRSLADYIPLVSTWIFKSLEKAMALAEVLEIRGYGKGSALATVSKASANVTLWVAFALIGVFWVVTYVQRSMILRFSFLGFGLLIAWASITLLIGRRSDRVR